MSAPVPGEPVPAFYDDLEATLAQAWAMLGRGVADRRSPFHTPSLATLGLDGRPRLRVVVLRGAGEGSLRFHTDRRSEKWAEMAREPRVALLGYDAGAKLQIRIEGRASLHADDAVADAAWAGSRPFSRVCYGVAPGPGTPLPAGDAFELPADEAAVEAGRGQFGAVLVRIEQIETLYLHRAGHRRARFDLAGGGSGWLTP